MTTSEPPPLHLDAEGLMSKWGFGDGDAFDDWWWDTFDTNPPVNSDDILHALIVEYLMSALAAAGHRGELTRIGTSHNPIRLETLDGAEVDHYSPADHFDPPICVTITRAQVEQITAKLTLTPKDQP